MLRRSRPAFCLLVGLTFSAASAAPDLFHGCAAGREAASQVLERAANSKPTANCEHHSSSPHHHVPGGGCDCLGYACCAVAVALGSEQASLAVAVTAVPATPTPFAPDTPGVGLRHRQPPALAPPTSPV